MEGVGDDVVLASTVLGALLTGVYLYLHWPTSANANAQGDEQPLNEEDQQRLLNDLRALRRRRAVAQQHSRQYEHSQLHAAPSPISHNHSPLSQASPYTFGVRARRGSHALESPRVPGGPLAAIPPLQIPSAQPAPSAKSKADGLADSSDSLSLSSSAVESTGAAAAAGLHLSLGSGPRPVRSPRSLTSGALSPSRRSLAAPDLSRDTGAESDSEAAAGPRARPLSPSLSLSCPICLNTLTHACETSCGHAFCGECIIAYWRTGGERRTVQCPVDRQPVKFLVRSLTLREVVQRLRMERDEPPAAGEAGAEMAERQRIDRDIDAYNLRFEGVSRRWIGENLEAAGRIPQGFASLSWRHKFVLFMLLLSGVCYLLSPLDIIPEAALGLVGLIDDILMLVLTVNMLGYYYRHV